MTLPEIKAAVLAGETVIWRNPNYRVMQDDIGQWLIQCRSNRSCIGLTHADGVTLNGDAQDFRTDD